MTVNELFEILQQNKPSVLLKENEDGLFDLIPELKKCKGFDQKSDWHIYDVLEHIYHVIDNTPNRLELRVASLFHDCKKPDTFSLDDEGRGHFTNHWYYGVKTFEQFAQKYGLDHDFTKAVSKLILYHDINLDALNVEQMDSMCSIFSFNEFSDLLELKKADLMASNPKYHYLIDNLYKNEDNFMKRKEIDRIKKSLS